MKVVFITPHLSTGGMPQYLNNKIAKLKDDCEIWVFEKQYEPSYNTIRLRIENQIGKDRIITWNKNPIKLLLDKIREISPDVIHFEEPCEQFLSDNLLEEIFTDNRGYKIFETFHDSSLEIQEKRFLPDKFIVVSPWQVFLLRELGIPSEVIEHEIHKNSVKDKEKSQKVLGLDPSKKHVIQVGIFTPRKNQRETAEIARFFPDVQFHFIGTLAENYKFYWQPIVDKLPPNCKIWGERDDVDLFYQAADLFILPSLPLFNDKETSPLVLKEAMLWETPIFMRDLYVYVDMFQESDSLKFMGNTMEETVKILENLFNTKAAESSKKIFEVNFSSDNNKLEFAYRDSPNLGNVWISVKDRDSNTCIYGFDYTFSHEGSGCWCIPIPKPYFNFSEDENFSGFKIEFYHDKSDHKPFYTEIIDLKKSICKKIIPSFPTLNFDPIFVNYTQFFVKWIYNGFFAGSRINKAIDIGANIGLFTEWVLDRFGSDTEIISVEPNLSAIESFNFLHGKKSNVHLEKYAVSKNSGDKIQLLINPGNSLISTFESFGESFSETQQVETITLLDLLQKYSWKDCDLLKLDVEGAEYEILEPLKKEDFRKFKYILIEFHNNKGRAKSLINRIRDADFSVDIRDDDTRYLTSENNDRGTIFATRID